MRRRAKWVGLALAAFLSGCGTAHNLNSSDGRSVPAGSGQDSPTKPCVTRVYGGVREDWAALAGMQWNDEFGFWIFNFLFIPFYAVDLPLSAVGDTLTLPYTVGHALFSQRPAPPPQGMQGRERSDVTEP